MSEGMRPHGAEQGAPKKVEEIKKDRAEAYREKREQFIKLKSSVEVLFGAEKIPKEIIVDLINIRKVVEEEIDRNQFVDVLDEGIDEQIQELAKKIVHFKDTSEKQAPVELEGQLYDELHLYYDTFRMAKNSGKFKGTVREVQADIEDEVKAHKLNLYSKTEASEALIGRVQEKYRDAGFSGEEIRDLVGLCDLKKLDTLEIQDIKVIAKMGDIFQRFLSGDRTKYVALAAALLVPAFVDGYAPSTLADAFKEKQVDMTQVGLFAALSVAAAGASAFINRAFKDFLNKNFSKEKGIGKHIAENLAHLPAREIDVFGPEVIKNRIANAKESYERILRTVSFDVLPAVVTLATSVAFLYEKSPALAVGTGVGAGIMYALDSFVAKRGKFWEKEGKAEAQAEKLKTEMDKMLSAHMEIVLSGMKDDLSQRAEHLLTQERIASSDKEFLKVVQYKIQEGFGALSFVIAGITTYLSGGGADKFIGALVYSGNFQRCVSTLVQTRRRLLGSFRDIQQMELMFNGYAAEEKEKEKTRVGMDSVPNADIDLNGVGVRLGRAKILDTVDVHIPQGSMAYLSGESGAGKTTLMKVISGYYAPTEGEAKMGGIDVEKIKKSGPDSIYSRIAYLSQFPYILEGTVEENLLFGIKEKVPKEKLREVLRELRLTTRFGNLSERLQGGRGDAGSVSGGEAARIGIARVLLKIRNGKSRVVFLDEPTASVDEATKKEIATILNKEKAARPDVTFVVISHDKDFVRQLNCSIEVEMEKGRVKSKALKASN